MTSFGTTGNRSLIVAPGVKLHPVEHGLYKLLRRGELGGWVERWPFAKGWLNRLPDADACLPEVHRTRRDAALGLLEVLEPLTEPEAPDWPVGRTPAGEWVLHCTRQPCKATFACAATDEVDAYLQAREKGWDGEDHPVCPGTHRFLGGAA